jgi:hypothetical protein
MVFYNAERVAFDLFCYKQGEALRQNQKSHSLFANDLFDGECPYADPSRTFFGVKVTSVLLIGMIILNPRIVK